MLIPQSKLVAINIPDTFGNDQNIPFSQDPDLLDSYIIGIMALSATDLAKYVDGSPVVTTAGLTGLNITVADMKNKERNQLYAMSDLRPANNAGMIRYFYPYLVKWEKSSYVTINDATVLTAGQAVVMQVLYCKADLWEEFVRQYKFYAGIPG